MSSRKRQRRMQEAGAEAAEAATSQVQQQALSAKADTELFVLDTVGSKSARRRISQTLASSDDSSLACGRRKSGAEQALLKKAVAKQQLTTGKSAGKQEVALVDLWGSSEVPSSAAPVRKGIRTPAPVPGQSYHPSPADHQKALAAATAAEEAKRAQDHKDKGSTTEYVMSAETKAVLVEDDEDDSEGSGSGSDSDGAGAGRRLTRREREGKLTRAQRNKKRSKAQAEHERLKALGDKRLQHELNNLPSLLKAARREERARAEKARDTAARHKAKAEEEAAAKREHRVLSHRDAGCVPLSDELGGSLRRLMPKKGALLSEELAKLQAPDVQEVAVQGRRRRRGGEKNPYGAKAVRWIPKYKYV